MKIALIAQIHHPVTDDFAGGIEVLNYNLANELFRRGHDIILFASGDSKTDAKLFPLCDKALFSQLKIEDPQVMRRAVYLENQGFLKAVDHIRKNGFDIIQHSHTSVLPVYLSKILKIPQVMTIHLTDNTNITLNKDLELLFSKGEVPTVSISEYQASILQDMKFIANIYNGLPIEEVEFMPNPKNYFAWLGRIAPNKGTFEAIEVAERAKVPLRLAGGLNVGKTIEDYFKTLKPHFNKNGIEYLGQANPQQKNNLLSQAKAVFIPIQWEEPFGLVMIEAMACGTPVIAFARGSVPEIVEDGKTGFIVNPSDDDKRGDWIVKKTGIEGMVEAVKLFNQMSDEETIRMRKNCRALVEQNFTIAKMVDGYEAVYKKVIEDSHKKA